VVAEPIEDNVTVKVDKGKYKEENPIIDDFSIYMSKKRKTFKTEDDPTPKKKKQVESSTALDKMHED